MKLLSLFVPTSWFLIVWSMLWTVINFLVYRGEIFSDPGHWYSAATALVLLFQSFLGIGWKVGKGITGE
jgi:hypothetical protein